MKMSSATEEELTHPFTPLRKQNGKTMTV